MEKDKEKRGSQVTTLTKYKTWPIAGTQETAVPVSFLVNAKGSQQTHIQKSSKHILSFDAHDERITFGVMHNRDPMHSGS